MTHSVTLDWANKNEYEIEEGRYLVTCLGLCNGNPIKYVVAEVRYLKDDPQGKWFVDLNGPASYYIPDRVVIAYAHYPDPYDIRLDEDLK